MESTGNNIYMTDVQIRLLSIKLVFNSVKY